MGSSCSSPPLPLPALPAHLSLISGASSGDLTSISSLVLQLRGPWWVAGFAGIPWSKNQDFADSDVTA